MAADASDAHDREGATSMAWRLVALAEDSYRFINVSGTQVDDIIVAAADPVDDADATEIDGPLDHVLGASTSPYYFDHSLTPGQYTLHWQPVAATSERSRTTPFTLPPATGGNVTLLRRDHARSDDGHDAESPDDDACEATA